MRKKIFLYLTITFSISWTCWLIVAFLTNYTNVKLFSPFALPLYSIGAAGPMIAACVVNKRSMSKQSFREFIKNIFNLRQPILAYLLTFVLAWGVCIFPVLVGTTQQQAPIYIALFQLPVMILFGGGLEEVGWRGYLLPQLQKNFLVSLLLVLWRLSGLSGIFLCGW